MADFVLKFFRFIFEKCKTKLSFEGCKYAEFNIYSENVCNFFENVLGIFVVYISICLERNDVLNFEIYRVLDIQGRRL